MKSANTVTIVDVVHSARELAIGDFDGGRPLDFVAATTGADYVSVLLAS